MKSGNEHAVLSRYATDFEARLDPHPERNLTIPQAAAPMQGCHASSPCRWHIGRRNDPVSQATYFATRVRNRIDAEPGHDLRRQAAQGRDIGRDMKTDQQPWLAIEKVRRRFETVVALEDVSLSVRRGEIVCLAGRSGCGKSSLLRIIAGIDQADKGRILLDGMEISGPAGHVEPEDRNIGFMFQDYALFPHLNVTENILFGLMRLERRAARRRCAELVERLGLQHLALRFPHMLSGGEQQRVALARALAPQPKIMLMDEPFSNLDRELRAEISAETIALLREVGTTIIMVTHDPEEALSAGDVVALMRAGKIVQVGTGDELYEQPSSSYAAEFFCTFNKIRGACKGGFADTPLGRFAAPNFADGEEATVYIRPHGLRVGSDGEGVECTVVGCSLMGEIEQVAVTASALAGPLRIRSTERRRLRPGDKVRVSVSSECVFVF